MLLTVNKEMKSEITATRGKELHWIGWSGRSEKVTSELQDVSVLNKEDSGMKWSWRHMKRPGARGHNTEFGFYAMKFYAEHTEEFKCFWKVTLKTAQHMY